MPVYVRCDIDITPGCCGVKQITDFSVVYANKGEVHHWDFWAEGATAEEAYTNLFNSIRAQGFTDEDEYTCAVLQIWFVKQKDFAGKYNEEYEAAPLMRLVQAIPNVVNLGEYLNPNSGNYIQGYQWAV